MYQNKCLLKFPTNTHDKAGYTAWSRTISSQTKQNVTALSRVTNRNIQLVPPAIMLETHIPTPFQNSLPKCLIFRIDSVNDSKYIYDLLLCTKSPNNIGTEIPITTVTFWGMEITKSKGFDKILPSQEHSLKNLTDDQIQENMFKQLSNKPGSG